jgi:hypothetical protein
LDGKSVDIKSIKTNNAFALYPTAIESDAVFAFNNATAGQVDISIYSLSGQKAATVYNGKIAQGEQQINWNSKDYSLNKGVYLAVITTADKKESVKFVVK